MPRLDDIKSYLLAKKRPDLYGNPDASTPTPTDDANGEMPQILPPPAQPEASDVAAPAEPSQWDKVKSYLTAKMGGAAPSKEPSAPDAAPKPDAGGDWEQALALGVAGLGDAVSAAGGRSTSHAADASKMIKAAHDQAFEEQQRARELELQKQGDDPNSDWAKSVQALHPMFKGMTPNQVSKIAPVLDTLVKEKGQEALKEATLRQSAQQHEDSMSMRKQMHEDSMALAGQRITNQQENEAKKAIESELSSRRPMGVQEAKINAAIHAGQLLEGAKDQKTGKYNINQITTPELALALSNLISNGQGGNLEQFKEMQPQTLKGELQKKIGFLLGKPVNVLTDPWAEQLKEMLHRQGTVSEDLKNGYVDQLLGRYSNLPPDALERIKGSGIGSSFRKTFKIKEGTGGNSGKPIEYEGAAAGGMGGGVMYAKNAKGDRIQSSDGGQTWQAVPQ